MKGERRGHHRNIRKHSCCEKLQHDETNVKDKAQRTTEVRHDFHTHDGRVEEKRS